MRRLRQVGPHSVMRLPGGTLELDMLRDARYGGTTILETSTPRPYGGGDYRPVSGARLSG